MLDSPGCNGNEENHEDELGNQFSVFTDEVKFPICKDQGFQRVEDFCFHNQKLMPNLWIL